MVFAIPGQSRLATATGDELYCFWNLYCYLDLITSEPKTDGRIHAENGMEIVFFSCTNIVVIVCYYEV